MVTFKILFCANLKYTRDLRIMSENSYTQKIDPSKEKSLKEKLSHFSFEDAPYSFWRAKGEGLTITFYKSGKLLIQGKNIDSFISKYLEEKKSFQPKLGFDIPQKENNPLVHNFESWIGTDESGKGDYFGPLVIASVAVEPKNIEILNKFDIKDSKKLDDAQIAKIAAQIKQNAVFSVVIISPQKYNELYSKFKNLNKLLAWGHARAIENVLEKYPDGAIKNAISDKFGNDFFIKNALINKAKQINLIQRTKAESDLAVAAASILARDEFVKRIKRLSLEFGLELPKGASPRVLDAAKKFITKHGKNQLHQVAKLHFKTTNELV